jgi:error-prone DNA polymerase
MARLFHRYPAALRRTSRSPTAAPSAWTICAINIPTRRRRRTGAGPAGTAGPRGCLALPRAGPPPKIVHRVEKELTLIREVDYAPYFLTVHDIVLRPVEGHPVSGRGSAANSVVCYLLGITEVPPESITLIFERFISKERGEPPDIDVDFEHERREEVIQWIYDRYGRDRAGLTATVIHFRSRAAIREVGKVMGLSQDVIARLSGRSGAGPPPPPARTGCAMRASTRDRRVRWRCADRRDHRLSPPPVAACRRLRHHPRPAGRAVPDRECRDGGPHRHRMGQGRHRRAGLLKVDILALGMLTAIRKAFRLIADHRGSS